MVKCMWMCGSFNSNQVNTQGVGYTYGLTIILIVHVFLLVFISPSDRLLVPWASLSSSVVPCTPPPAGGGCRSSLTSLRTGEKAKWSQVWIPLPVTRHHKHWLDFDFVFENKGNLTHIYIYTVYVWFKVHRGLYNFWDQRAMKTYTNFGKSGSWFTHSKTTWHLLVGHVWLVTSLKCLQSRYLLLKEKNMLLTIQQEAKHQIVPMPSPERLKKVK